MLNILLTIPPSNELFDAVFYDMRNSWQSWDKANEASDIALAKRLQSAGDSHGKVLRQIGVYVRIQAPDYWWRQFDTMTVGVAQGDVVQNSTSVMHTAGKRDFTAADFAPDVAHSAVITLNEQRALWIANGRKRGDEAWRRLVASMPAGYLYTRGVSLNYQVLYRVLIDRRNHRLDEWATFCDWARSLPRAELLEATS
jgi:hypothetical protein